MRRPSARTETLLLSSVLAIFAVVAAEQAQARGGASSAPSFHSSASARSSRGPGAPGLSMTASPTAATPNPTVLSGNPVTQTGMLNPQAPSPDLPNPGAQDLATPVDPSLSSTTRTTTPGTASPGTTTTTATTTGAPTPEASPETPATLPNNSVTADPNSRSTTTADPNARAPLPIQSSGGTAAPVSPGATGGDMQECMAAWDDKTHISKVRWREICARTLTEAHL